MVEVVVLLVLVLVLVDIKQEVENLGRSDMQRLLGSWLTIHCSAPSAVSILGLFSLWSRCKRVSANASQSFVGGRTLFLLGFSMSTEFGASLWCALSCVK